MRLTSFTDYSLRTLMYLATHSERLCTNKEIAERFGIPLNHMTKIAHNLGKMECIYTQKGKNGGIRLAKSPEQINIGELVRKLEPDLHLVECFNCTTNKCRITLVCKLKNVFFQAYQAFIKELDAHTLADITDNQDELLEILR